MCVCVFRPEHVLAYNMTNIRLPKHSWQPDYDNVKYSFTPGFGFHVVSPIIEALHSRYVSMNCTNNHVPALLNCLDSSKSPMRRQREANARGYLNELTRNERRVEHTALNMDRSEMYQLEQFQMSIDVHTDPAWYNAMLTNKPPGLRNNSYNSGAGTEQYVCLGFQRFMQLDMISMLMDRSGLSHHRKQILTRIKYQLGLDSLTSEKVDELQRRLDVRVVGHNIRRREGKSVSVYVNLAIMLTSYPAAGLLGLYTVHTTAGTTSAYRSVGRHVPSLLSHFNDMQLSRYNTRVRGRGGRVDPEDYYYRGVFEECAGSMMLTVRFFKHDSTGMRNDGQAINENVLRFRTCAKEDVSILFYAFFICIFSQ